MKNGRRITSMLLIVCMIATLNVSTSYASDAIDDAMEQEGASQTMEESGEPPANVEQEGVSQTTEESGEPPANVEQEGGDLPADSKDSAELEGQEEMLPSQGEENALNPTGGSVQPQTSSVQEEEEQQPMEESEESEQEEQPVELKENSWRYTDGVLTVEESRSSARKARANFTPWTKVDGNYINSSGQIIPRAVARGIDVSHHQGVIDWTQVKNADVSFAIIRCGYGNNIESQDDRQWLRNVSECERLGIPYGVYIYSYAQTTEDAKSEAEHVLRLIKGRSLSYPVFLDLEDDTTATLSNAEIVNIAKTFCSIIAGAGYSVGVYANTNWFTTRLTDSYYDTLPKWVAQYNTECKYTKDYMMWQCTSKGSIPGISGYVDLNFLMGDHGYWMVDGNNTYYYFNGKKITNQNYKIDGYWYYFDANGVMQKNWWRTSGNNKFYYDSNGRMQSDQGCKIDGHWYYFASNGAMQKNYWRNRNGVLYYYDSNGRMLSNQEAKIEGNWYVFTSSGAVRTNWWQTKGAEKYYYGANGQRVVNKGYKIGNYWYYFNASGAMQKGWREKNGDWYYYDGEGHMLGGKGYKIDGYWYYFNTSGAMQKGWREKNGDWYYYDGEGHMLSGKGYKIDGYWYYFNTSGAMQKGWREKNGDWYYYDGEGHMLSGKGYKIDGYWYYFNTSGAMHKGWRQKDGGQYYYGEDGRMFAGITANIGGSYYTFASSGRVI